MARRRARVSERVAEIGSAIAAQRSARSVHILRVWQASRGRELSSRWQSRTSSQGGERALRVTWRCSVGPTPPREGIWNRPTFGSSNGLAKEVTSDRPSVDALHGAALETISASSFMTRKIA